MKSQYQTNRVSLYGYLEPEEEKILDIIVEDGNYGSRTELLTTMLRYLIHKGDIYAPEQIHNALGKEIQAYKSLDAIRETLYGILDECGKPVLANRGTENGYQALRDHLKQELYERIGKVPDEHLLHTWTKQYCDLHHADFIAIRLDVSTRNYAESCGFDTGYD